MKHLLVTNDFPPKVGGIQSYLWELWRRLPSEEVTVLTTPYEGAEAFDREQSFRVVRTREPWLLPRPRLVRQINELARSVGAEMVVLDPALPLGWVGPSLELPYVVIGHGAELTIPSRLPLTNKAIARVLNGATGVIGGGLWVEAAMREITRSRLPSMSIPPGVDTERFRVLSEDERGAVRAKYGMTEQTELVVGISRLVPRKGFERLIRAAADLGRERPDLWVLIAGSGRERNRLERLIRQLSAPVTLLGRVPHEDLPGLYGAAEVFCMPCHDRWFGLECEGFGIVFAEAAATGVPSVAGLSGGSAEAVVGGAAGIVVEGKVLSADVGSALRQLLEDPARREALGKRARIEAVERFSYDKLANGLKTFLEEVGRRR